MFTSASLRFAKIASALLFALVGLSVLTGCGGAVTAASSTSSTSTTTPATPAPSIAYNPTLNQYYVANGVAGTVSIYDGSSNALLNSVSVAPAGSDVYWVAVDSGSNMLYVLSKLTGTMTVINAQTSAIVTTVPNAVSYPAAIAVNSTTHMVYVLGLTGTNNLNVYSGATNALSGSVLIPGAPTALTVDPTADTVLVSYFGSGTLPSGLYEASGDFIAVIDGSTNTLTNNTIMTVAFSSVAIDDTTNTVYGTAPDEQALNVFAQSGDPAQWSTGTLVRGIGTSPSIVTNNQSTHVVYTADVEGNTVSAVNGTTGSVAASVAIPATPTGIAVNQVANLVYVATTTGVTVINGASNTVSTTVALPTAAE